MDSRPPNLLLPLLLTGLLHFWQCARGQSSFIIDDVELAVHPSTAVQSGTPVTLLCKVSVSHDNRHDNPHLTHTFELKRDDALIDSITTTDDTFAHELSPARAADSGSYECRVTVKGKSKTSASKKLSVTGLQTPLLLLNNTAPYESEEFKVTCIAPGEKGDLIFRFHQEFRTGKSQIIKQTKSAGNSSETTLVLSQVGDSVLYCDYEIYLVSGNRQSNRSNEIQVLVKRLYISPVMNVLPSQNVSEGDILEVVCKVVNPPRNVEVFLTKDRRILKQAQFSLNHRFTAQEGDTGEFVCKAESGNMQKETTLHITVKELFSKPLLTVEPVDIFKRDRFWLTCSVPSYDPEKTSVDAMRFSIYKYNVKVNSSATYTALAGSSADGNYTCKAQTALTHTVIKESQTVVVKAKVPVSKPVLQVVGGELVLGKRFQLVCHSDSGSLPIRYTLYSPVELPQSTVVTRPGEKAVFNSSAIGKKSDLSNFLCHAKNSPNKPPAAESGQQLLRSTIIIEPVSKPLLKVQPEVGDISEGQDVILHCSVQGGTPPISFSWYRNENEVLASQSSKELKAVHRIKNIRGEHNGRYFCVTSNPANEAKRSDILNIGVKMAGWKKGLIAVLCILLIVALILVIMFKRRLLQFKRKTTGELSVKAVGTKVERLSLTQAEVNEAANVTPGMMGKSVWSGHVSGSESDDQSSVTAPENPEPQYTEVQIKTADPNRAPVKKGTDTVYSEVRNSKQDVPEPADGQGSVEYAQLNHDAAHHSDHGNHGDHSAQEDPTGEAGSSVDSNTADPGE